MQCHALQLGSIELIMHKSCVWRELHELWFHSGHIWISIINKTLGTTVGSSMQFCYETIYFAIPRSHGYRWPWISDNSLESIARNFACLISSWRNVLRMLPFNTRNAEAEQSWVDERTVAVSKPINSLREEENCRPRCAPILHSANPLVIANLKTPKKHLHSLDHDSIQIVLYAALARNNFISFSRSSLPTMPSGGTLS